MMRARDREAHALEMRVTDERRTDARKSFLIGQPKVSTREAGTGIRQLMTTQTYVQLLLE